MGLSLELKRGFLRCISPNFRKTFRNAFIGRNRRAPASLSTAAGQRLAEDPPVLAKIIAGGSVIIASVALVTGHIVLDDSQQREQDAHRDGKRFIGRSDEVLTAFDGDDG
jgi:hypothetical protein